VSVRDELSQMTPRLRRFARALTQASPNASDTADELVHATFLRILECGLSERKSDLVMQVFSLLTQLHRESQQHVPAEIVEATNASDPRGEDSLARVAHSTMLPKGLSAALASLRLDEREALLLIALEGFSYAQAARILHVSRGGLLARLGRARTRLSEALADTPQPSARRMHLRVVK